MVSPDKRVSFSVNATTLSRDICVIRACIGDKVSQVLIGRTYIKFMGAKSECWDNAIAVGFCFEHHYFTFCLVKQNVKLRAGIKTYI